jgi:hypothetical protein
MSSVRRDSPGDPIVELYKQAIDREMIRENLGKSHEARLLTLEQTITAIHRLHSPGSRPATTQFATLLSTLCRNKVAFVIVGGIAAVLHGAIRVTYDIDVVYERSDDNLTRIVAALAPLEPYLRDAPPRLPFHFTEETLRRGLNFKLATTKGAIDLMGELAGVGSFAAVNRLAIAANLAGSRHSFLELEALIAAKRVAGRAKDLESIAELETILHERDAASHDRAAAAPAADPI